MGFRWECIGRNKTKPTRIVTVRTRTKKAKGWSEPHPSIIVHVPGAGHPLVQELLTLGGA